MGLYNFQKRFAPMIMAGTKMHTIRAERAHPDKPGNILYLYTGLRQKGAQLLKRVRCTKIERIEIDVDQSISIDGIYLSVDEEEALARLDGFRDFLDFCEFWDGRRPFKGQVIHWKELGEN